MTPVLVADFGDDAPRGRALIDAARRVGAAWVVTRVGADASELRPTVRAAADCGVGLLVRVGDTKCIADLEDAVGGALGERSVPALRDRIVFASTTERIGKRLRQDAKWAPSAADLGEMSHGLAGLLRRVAPNYVRALCLADDLIVPQGLVSGAKLAAVAAKLRRGGGRLWVSGTTADAAPADAFAVVSSFERA